MRGRPPRRRARPRRSGRGIGDTLDTALETDEGADGVSLACAPGGGREAVASFTLLEDADLTVEFAQAGDHVLALARNIGAACDAMVLACEATGGTFTGTVSFPGVDAGSYFLIAEAVSPDDEGALLLTIGAD